MSSTGALAHVRSACIGVHLAASALDACLLACAAARRTGPQGCPVAAPQPAPIAPCDAGRDGGSDRLRRFSAATPRVQRSGLAGASKLPASAMRSAAKSPCTNSARRGDGGTELPHKAQALGARWSNAGRPVAWRQEPMHQNGPARWAAEQPAGRITTAGGAAQKRQAGKQENGTADARRCTQMGWGPACSFGAKPNRQCLVSKAVALVRIPSVCIRVHLWFHISCCLAACRNFLLPCHVPHPAPRALGSRCSARPHAPARLPGRRCPPSHPACNETMASLTRDRSG